MIQGVANDLKDLASGIDTALENGQGTQATNDPGTEEDVVGAFNQVSYHQSYNLASLHHARH